MIKLASLDQMNSEATQNCKLRKRNKQGIGSGGMVKQNKKPPTDTHQHFRERWRKGTTYPVSKQDRGLLLRKGYRIYLRSPEKERNEKEITTAN